MTATDFETISLSIDDRGVATVALARAEKHNAMNATMIRELQTCVDQLGADDNIRTVVLKADGPTFCAGGDLRWMQDQAELDRAGKIESASELAKLLRTLDVLPKTTIARVQGNSFGGGLGLISVCDIAICVSTARFGLTETRLGLIPATIGPFVARKLAAGFGRQVFFSGRMFDAQFGLNSGLLAEVVDADALDAAVENAVTATLQTAPGAVASAKGLLRTLTGDLDEETISATVNALADRWESDEAQAGIEAFFERKPMPWAKDKQTN